MSWEDRIVEGSYTASNGDSFTFQFEDVSRSFDRFTSVHNFPYDNVTFAQDIGQSGYSYDLQLIIVGPENATGNCDIEADRVEKVLRVGGTGVLQHPMYGRMVVMVSGKIERSDKLKTGYNQVLISCTFIETTRSLYEASVYLPGATGTTDGYITTAYVVAPENETTLAQVSFRENIRSLCAEVRSKLSKLTNSVSSLYNQFNNTLDDIVRTIDLTANAPALILTQLSIAIQLPGQAVALIEDRLQGYANTITTILGYDTPVIDSDGAGEAEVRANDFVALSCLVGASRSVILTNYRSQPEVLNTAEQLSLMLDSVVDWRDSLYDSTGLLDSGEVYQLVHDITVNALHYLITISAGLPLERTIFLTVDRNLVELCAELYGEVDERLDEFIQLNDLTGDELLIIPAGSQVVYYAE